MDTLPKPTCHHLFNHPATDADHVQLAEALAYARSIGDNTGIMIGLARLYGAAACRAELTAAAR
ncbi:hypothetical protein [Kitasatospora sp. NPDC058478]|uniref:hypothetical protein n=1 Tax=unclassified Kitasatospora TaxID=2633591 RepID=UPI003652F3B3